MLRLRIFYCIALIAAFTLATTPMVSEENDEAGLGVDLGGGTLGTGVDLSYKVSEKLSLRGNTNFGNFSMPDYLVVASIVNGIPYDYEADMSATGLLADYGTGGLRFTAGIYYNDNDIRINNTPILGWVIGDNLYSATEIGVLSADTNFRRFAPYLGFGTERPFFEIFPDLPLKYYIRVGVLYQGSPNLSMTASAGGVADADLALEAKEFDDVLTLLKYYPVFATGVSVKF